MDAQLKTFDVLKALSDRIATDEGTKKPHHYFDVYAKYIGPMREAEVNILELGVYSGASLLIWREFFPRATIVGLDVRPAPERILPALEAGQLHFIQGDQSLQADLERCLLPTAGKRFDIIIDDASHVGSLSRASFNFLFPHALRDGGLYIVEDYGTGYMADFYDGAPFTRAAHEPDARQFPSHHAGMVGWMKQLIDELHGPAIMPGAPGLMPIDSIEFFPSIAVVRKA